VAPQQLEGHDKDVQGKGLQLSHDIKDKKAGSKNSRSKIKRRRAG
jgi:hypothetical protein